MNSKILSVAVVLLMCLPALMAVDVYAETDGSDATADLPVREDPAVDPADALPGDYVQDTVLVKDDDFSAERLPVPYVSAEPIFPGSQWYIVKLADGLDAKDALETVRSSGQFQDCDLDYVKRTHAVAAAVAPPDVSKNPEVGKSAYLDTMGVKKAWAELAKRGINPGGSRDVVVAVVDSGVLYDHEDLKDNIWHNLDEIPGNGIDDDSNGYVDDTIGWNFAYKNNDPKDDNGHGTHVAGLVAAANNDKGTVGVAFNCQIMCLKAGDSQGQLSDSDIAAAICYAADNGASVINMSIGGFGISKPYIEALSYVYDRCITVAAAGNEQLCNDPTHDHTLAPAPSFPGAMYNVIGVMSTDMKGDALSWFSNYDHSPYDDLEYEVYAAGEAMYSTWSDGGYSTQQGTSMASPVVAGIVALMLSSEPDREKLTLDMVRAAVVNSGTAKTLLPIAGAVDPNHNFVDAYDAMVNPLEKINKVVPKTAYFSDSKLISDANNGNRVVEPGETIQVAADVFNHGYRPATDVTVELYLTDEKGAVLDVISNEYLEMVTYSSEIGTIGPYEVKPCGAGHDDTGCPVYENAFALKVSPDCPNGKTFTVKLITTYTDPKMPDGGIAYRDFTFTVHRTVDLSTLEITEDTVLDSDMSYIMRRPFRHPPNYKLCFAPGTVITVENGASFDVSGTIEFQGTGDDRVRIVSADGSVCPIRLMTPEAKVVFENCDINGMFVTSDPHGGASYSSCDMTMPAGSNGDLPVVLSSFNDSYFRGSAAGITVSGASGSALELSGDISGLRLVDGAVNDCVFMMDNVTSSEPVVLDCDMQRVMFIGPQDSEGPDFASGPGMNVSDVCFAGGLQDPDSVPTVSASEVDKTGMWPTVTQWEIMDGGAKVDHVHDSAYTLRLLFSKPIDDAKLDVSWELDDGWTRGDVVCSFLQGNVWEGTLDLSDAPNGGIATVSIEGTTKDGTEIMPSAFSVLVEPSEEVVVYAELSTGDNGVDVNIMYNETRMLMGYNMYREDVSVGEKEKMNTDYVLIPYLLSLTDTDVVPGHTYLYTVEAVDMNLREFDTVGTAEYTVPEIIPCIEETLIEGEDLTVSCTVTEVEPDKVVLRYEAGGVIGNWKGIEMAFIDGRYVCTVPGKDLSRDGFSFYIYAEALTALGTCTIFSTDGRSPDTLDVGYNAGSYMQAETEAVPTEGEDLTVRCTVTEIQPDQVVLHYVANGAQTGWKDLRMVLIDGCYMCIIPGEDVGRNGISYYITAESDGPTAYIADPDDPAEMEVVYYAEHDDTAEMAGAVILVLLSVCLLAVFRRRM